MAVSSGAADGRAGDGVAAAGSTGMAAVPPVVQVLAGNSVTGPAVLFCLNTTDTRALRELHPAVAGVVAGVPWADKDTAVVRWRAALPAAVGVRVDRLPREPDALAAAAAALAGTTRLDLNECGGDATAAVLALLPPSLRVLRVLQPRTLISGANLAHLTALESLECDNLCAHVDRLPPSLCELHLHVFTGTLSPMADFSRLVALRVLSVSDENLSSAAIASLPPSLEEFDVDRARLPIGVSFAHLPRLRVLRGRHNDTINGDTVATLPPCMVELTLPWCRVSLLFAHLHELQVLDVSHSSCGDASLASLPPSLVTLDVSWCRHLTPTAVLPHLPALTMLTLNGTSVGDALVASLPAGLTTLGIVDCPRVTNGATFDHLPMLRELHGMGADLSPAALAACRARGCAAPANGVLRGHDRDVSCLAVLPDGRLASGDKGCAVRLWDMERRGEASVVRGEGRQEAAALAVLSDGLRLAVGYRVFGRIIAGDCLNGVTIHSVSTDGGVTSAHHVEGLRNTDVSSLAVLTDGRLAAGCGDGNVRVVDVDAATEVALLTGHTARVAALAVLADGRLASGSWDASVRVWDAGARACVATLAGYKAPVTALAVLPDGRLASGEEDGAVQLWDVSSAACEGELAGHSKRVTALAVLPDGRLASGSWDGTIRLWTVQRAAGSRLPVGYVPGRLLGPNTIGVAALATLLDGRLASCDGNRVRLWHPPPPPPEP